MKTIGVLVLLVAVGGCGNAHKMNRLSIGMTKAEVIKAMGRPTSTASPGNGHEILVYRLYPTGDEWWYGTSKDYFVRLIDGKVESYGEKGDFDSTKDPTVNVNLKAD